MKVDLKAGAAIIRPVPGRSFNPTEIPKAVKDAGFTPGEIKLTAAGTLAKKGDLLRLEMTGALAVLVLAGGERAGELEKRSDLLGRRVRVRGALHASHGDQPPGLTVEGWEEAAKPGASQAEKSP